MNSDPEAKSILNDVNIKLKNHGVENLRQIFKYCDGQPKADGASAFFSQNVKIIEKKKNSASLHECFACTRRSNDFGFENAITLTGAHQRSEKK